MTIGRVYLVGSGPGDPGLLTLRAARLLRAADVVVYDNLVGDAILDRLPPSADRVYAGKETGSHTMDQAAINRLLEDRARAGARVVRLKGGDPFVFGRGGEEAEYLAARGIPFEVVPGVTAAIGVPAYAGIPVTHRGVAASVAVVTGRAGPFGEAADVEWERIAGADTIVVLMGVANQDALARTLIENGRNPDTPVAAIRWGTTAQQQTVVATLGTLGERLHAANLRSPAILVVGAVVSLMETMAWIEWRPLFGRRVLVLAGEATPLTDALEDLGAEVLQVSPVEVTPPASWAALDANVADLGAFRGVLFGDAEGTDAFFARLAARGRDARALASHTVAADVAALDRLARHGVRAAVDGADDIARHAGPASPGWWLVLGAPDTQAELADRLGRAGIDVVTPACGALGVPKARADRLRELLGPRAVHGIVFRHPLDVRRLAGALDDEERQALARVTLVAVGTATADALRGYGFAPATAAGVDAVADTLVATLPGGEAPRG
ncbi:MAG: uroporphyrinogen-III C-methyltransferase [Candidatus Rokubacteria bacterium]|nr:uroporphyrinogen-III C-methyltransferase [Candidatus Rokubacteria bacterium]